MRKDTALAILLGRCEQMHVTLGRPFVPNGTAEPQYVLWYEGRKELTIVLPYVR